MSASSEGRSASVIDPMVTALDRTSCQAASTWQTAEEYVINSRLEVTVGGQPAEVRSTIGWPGQTNV